MFGMSSVLAPVRSLASAIYSPFASTSATSSRWSLVNNSDGMLVGKDQIRVSFHDLCVEFVTKQTKDLFKAVQRTTFWLERGLTGPSVLLQSIGKDASHGKNWFSVLDLTKRVPEFAQSVTALWNSGASVVRAGSVLTSFGDCVNSVNDGLSLVNRYVPLRGLAAVGNLNVSLCFLASSYKSAVHCSEMVSAETNGQKGLTLMRLAIAVSYVAFSSYSLACLATGAAASAVVIVGSLTSVVIWTIASFFFERIYDPYNENACVNWKKVAKNTDLAPSLA